MNNLRQSKKENRYANFQGQQTTYHRFANKLSGIRNLVSGVIFLVACFMLWGSASANPYLPTATNTTVSADSAPEHVPPAFFPVKFFSKYISPVDGNRCPMYPSCSKYCLEAAQKHGILMGWIMACDRLIRCGRDEKKFTPTVMLNDTRLSYDPVANNDFWR